MPSRTSTQSEIARRADALDVQTRKSHQRLGKRAAACGRRAVLHFDQPITRGTPRLQCGDDVLGLEARHAVTDDENGAIERDGADAWQAIATARDFAGGLPVDNDGTDGAAVSDRLAAVDGRWPWRKW